MKTSEIIILIGPPCIGKSTWIYENLNRTRYDIINRDVLVEEIAVKNGLSYDEMFSNFSKTKELQKEVDHKLNENFQNLVRNKKNIVIDMTNMSSKSRAKFIQPLKNHPDYKKIAVLFLFEEFSMNELIKLSEIRNDSLKENGKSKTIPRPVYEKMISMFMEPSKEEGFDEIRIVNNYKDFRNLIAKNSIND